MGRRKDPDLRPLEKVLLLPEISGYLHRGRSHRMAVADPVVVEHSSEVPVSLVLSPLEHGYQQVRGCIMLSPGYAPADLRSRFNAMYVRDGKEYLLKDIPQLSDEEAAEVVRVVVKELETSEIRIVDRVVSVRDAASSGAILGATLLESPIVKHGGTYHCRAVLWDGSIRHGDKVPVFVSPSGVKTIREFLKVDEARLPSWPDLPLQIVEETTRVLPKTCADFTPLDLDRIVLLPQVTNYTWHGKRHDLAVVDPVVVNPGETAIAAALSSLEVGKQRVRRCILLARGLSPGGLFPLFNAIGTRGGKSFILIDLPVLAEAGVGRVGRAILKQLEEGEVLVRGPAEEFKEAIQSESVLSYCWINSAKVKKTSSDGLPRNTRIALWDASLEGQRIPVCMSSKGLKTVREVLAAESSCE